MIDSWLIVGSVTDSHVLMALNGKSAKISWIFTDCLLRCQSSVDWELIEMSIEYPLRESTDTDTADAFSKPDYDILNMLVHAFSSQLDIKMGFSRFNAGVGEGGGMQ